MKLLNGIFDFFCGLIKLIRNVAFISFMFLLATFILAIFMPDKVVGALEIFKNLFKIP
jgi:hypothetical protein